MTVKKSPARKSAARKPATKKSPARKPAAKKVVKKATGTKSAKKGATKTAKKATKKKATARRSVTAARNSSKKATTRSAKATKKKVVRKKSGPLTVAEIRELPTEEIWAHYGRACKNKEAERIEHIRNVLMERHYPLVRYIAERLLQTLPKSIELDDLISAGLFGLMDAIRGFDPDRGIKFKTYCSTRIRGAILDQLRSQDWVPRLVRLKASRIERALQKLTAEYGREPTHAELARTLDMDHQDLVKEIQDAVCQVFGVEAAVIRSDRRTKSVTEPRMLAMWLARKYTTAACSEIGDQFGSLILRDFIPED